MRCALAVLALGGFFAQESPPPPETAAPPAPAQEDDAARRLQRLQKAFLWLEDEDPGVRDLGRQEILKAGREAVPLLEKKLTEKGVAEYARLLRQIDAAASAANENRWVHEKDLPTEAELAKDLPKLAPGTADKYVHAKLYEAWAHAKRGNFQKGYDLAKALETLEPKAATSDKVRQLRRYCDNMITQTSLVEAKVIQEKLAFVAGERAELTLRMKNLFRNAITIEYEKGTPANPGRGLAVVEIEIRTPEPTGSMLTLTRSSEIQFEPEIPIATGAQWERKFGLETDFGADDRELFRLVVVNVWTQPERISAGSFPFLKRIQFEPAVLKLVPRKHEKYVGDPLGGLKQVLESGDSADAISCAMLLEGDQKRRGVDLLIQELRAVRPGFKGDLKMRRTFIAHLLAFVTGERLGDDPARWEEWAKSGSPKPK